MQNIERRNSFFNNNSPYISKDYPKNYQKNSSKYNKKESLHYLTNEKYQNDNTKSVNESNIKNISYLNYNQPQLVLNKFNSSSNLNKNSQFSQSIPNLNSPNPSKYFSPLPKNNIENINYSNLNLKHNNINISSPPFLFVNGTNKTNNSNKYINNKINNNKKTLILDLDETLVHSGFHPFNRKSDFTLNINVDGKNHTIYVLKRPYVDEFLSEISPFFEIIFFTASISEYASPVMDQLDKEQLTYGRKFRQDCLFNHGLYLKDLRNIGKNLKDVIIIDNNPVSYALNQENGIPILTWYEDLNDKELINLIPLLKYLSTVSDVRPVIKQIVDRQKNIINFDLVENLIKNKITENNNYKKIIYETNDNYKENTILRNKYSENKYLTNNRNYHIKKYNSDQIDKFNNNKDDINYGKAIDELSLNENEYKNYLINENLYKYNNNIHDSLSNMTYNEIQNEGQINNNSNYSKNYNDNKENKENKDYNSFNFFNEKEKNAYQNKTNRIMDSQMQQNKKFGDNVQNNLIYKYTIDDSLDKNNDIKMNMNMSNNYQEKNDYYKRSFTPNINMQKKSISFYNNRKNDINKMQQLNKENIPNKNMINSDEKYNQLNYNRKINNFYNDKNNEYLKTNKYLVENNNYLENLTKQKKENENYNEYYLKSYQQQLFNSRINNQDYINTNTINKNNFNNNNIHIYSNNDIDYLPQNYNKINNLNNINNRNNSMNNLNFKKTLNFNNTNNKLFGNDNNNNYMNERNKFKLNNYLNNIKNELNINNYNNIDKDNNNGNNNQKDYYRESIKIINDTNKYIMNKESHLYNSKNNLMMNNKNENSDNDNYQTFLKKNNNGSIHKSSKNYLNENELKKEIPQTRRTISNNTINNEDLIHKERFNFPRYYIDKEANNNQIKIGNTNSNKDLFNYRNQRIETDIEKNKYNNYLINNIKMEDNKNNNNKIKNLKKNDSNIKNNSNFQDKQNVIIKKNNLEFPNTNYYNNNNDYYKYLKQFNKSDERDKRVFSESPNNNHNYYQNKNNLFQYNNNLNDSPNRIYNNTYLNNKESPQINKNYNNININNYNFYNSLIDNKDKMKYNINNNGYNYNNIYNLNENNFNKNVDDENNENIKMMNRSSSYFHPRNNYNTYFDLENKEKNGENNIKINNKEFVNRKNNQNNYFEKNNNFNSFIPNTINRNISLKSKFLND